MAHRIHIYVFNRIFLVDTEDMWVARSGLWYGWLAALLSKQQSDYSLHIQVKQRISSLEPQRFPFQPACIPPALPYSFSPLGGLSPQSTLGSPKALAVLPCRAPDSSLSSSLTPLNLPILLSGVMRLKLDHKCKDSAQNRHSRNISSFQHLFPFHLFCLSQVLHWAVDRLTCQVRSARFGASAKWRVNPSQHICGGTCCLSPHPFNFLGETVPQLSFGNIFAPTFHFCGINSNSSCRVGSNWFKLGRGEGNAAGRHPCGIRMWNQI